MVGFVIGKRKRCGGVIDPGNRAPKKRCIVPADVEPTVGVGARRLIPRTELHSDNVG